ncbi:Cof-type HAD-IIB family hydrolase [Sphingomonas montana]|uniref:Cof-type HAD-IIB family hydrolase n=1 Tax=Sphingomonas montana TaxID=1843236 RepID=UPI00096EF95E|nr:Cof-type HAD-IIB family hydrolase [Sphingomonas montana]
MTRLFVSDIDGTLVRKDKVLTEPTVAAIHRLRAAGVPVTLISARPPSGMIAHGERLGIDLPMGAFNGGTIFMPDGTILSAAHVPADVAADTLDRLRAANVDRWVFADGKWFASAEGNHNAQRERIAAAIDPIYTDDFTAVIDRIDKIVGVSDDAPLVAGVERDLIAAHGPAATIACSQPYYLDITALAANKGDGVAALCAAVGVALADVTVAGDMPNDLPMFARAGTSIAMGQAPQAVRDAATRVTGPTDADGLADAVNALAELAERHIL